MDTSPPEVAAGPLRLACSSEHCNANAARLTPLGFMQYSPNASMLHLDLTSMDDPDGDIDFSGVQVLKAVELFGALPGNADCQASPLANTVGVGNASAPFSAAPQDFNTVIELGSGTNLDPIRTTPLRSLH